MTKPNILVSVLLTVYNKEAFLPATLASLRQQIDENQIEYIIADDASTDDSVAIAQKILADAPHVTILTNIDNKGPAVRLNQAGQTARGEYLYFLDSDDIAPLGAIDAMINLLKDNHADIIYSRWEKRYEPAERLLKETIKQAPHTISDKPLDYIMKGGFIRMALMCKRSLFIKALGCDDTLFIQDESLPLRLCAHAKRLIDWQAKAVLVPLDETEESNISAHLSADKTQQHHDRFFAYYNFLSTLPERHAHLRATLSCKALSSYIKYLKKQNTAAWKHRAFWHYLWSKVTKRGVCNHSLNTISEHFKSLPNIRRV